MILRYLSAALALALASTLALSAHEYKAGDLEIVHPYAFETAPTAMSAAGYIRAIINHGSQPDRLIGITADYAQVGLHESSQKDGVASMRAVEGIDIPAGATVELSPGGLHIMFLGLDGKPFVGGTVIPATLMFQRAGEVAVEFKVGARNGTADADAAMEGMGHMNHDAKGTAP